MPAPAQPLLALYTCAAFPDLYEDDLRLASAFATVGLATRPQLWDQPEPPAPAPRAAFGLLRSTWDYYLRLPEFDAFLTAHETSGRPLLNPVPLLRWNLDKRYLLDLQAAGVPIVPTTYRTTLDPAELPALWQQHGELVVKPTISAGSWRTLRLPVGTLPPQGPPERTRGATSDSPSPEPTGYLIQPYLPQIEDGEWSLVFFGGEYSHAVRKRPKPGDFRVQEHYGGHTVAEQPPAHLLAQATEALHAVCRIPGAASPTVPCYARVDGVCDNDRFLLMELELIEPALYFRYTEGGEARLARAVAQALAL